MVAETEAQLGPIDLLVANAGIDGSEPEGGWEVRSDEWWHVFEVNVLGVYLSRPRGHPGDDRARARPDRERRERRRVPARRRRAARTARARPPSTG